MKSKTITKLFILAFFTIIFSSCGSHTVKTNFTAGNYTLSLNNPAPNPLPVYIKNMGCVLDGHPLPGNTKRFAEIKKGIEELSTLLDNCGLFKSVEEADNLNTKTGDLPDSFLMEVSFIEEEDTHTAGAVGKAFASGFFTLGLAPVTYNYSYSSRMEIRMSRANSEIISTYSQKSADASSSHMKFESDGSMPERTITRRFITTENNKAITDFLVKNRDKLYTK